MKVKVQLNKKWYEEYNLDETDKNQMIFAHFVTASLADKIKMNCFFKNIEKDSVNIDIDDFSDHHVYVHGEADDTIEDVHSMQEELEELIHMHFNPHNLKLGDE